MGTILRSALIATILIGIGVGGSGVRMIDAQAPPPTTSAVEAPPGVGAQLAASLQPTLARVLGLSDFTPAYATCVESAIGTLDPATRGAVDQLIQDPSLFDVLDDAQVEVIVRMYLDCVGSILPMVLPAVITGAREQSLCFEDTWVELIPTELVASSIAYGNGLDDLPVSIVDQMTLAVATCVPDPQWWIDDETSLLQRRGLDADVAACTAATLVDEFGIGPIIKQRLLTLFWYPVPRSEQERIGLAERCGAPLPGSAELNATRGCASPAS